MEHTLSLLGYKKLIKIQNMLQMRIKDQIFLQNPLDGQVKEIHCKGPLVEHQMELEIAIAILSQLHLVYLQELMFLNLMFLHKKNKLRRSQSAALHI